MIVSQQRRDDQITTEELTEVIEEGEAPYTEYISEYDDGIYTLRFNTRFNDLLDAFSPATHEWLSHVVPIELDGAAKPKTRTVTYEVQAFTPEAAVRIGKDLEDASPVAPAPDTDISTPDRSNGL